MTHMLEGNIEASRITKNVSGVYDIIRISGIWGHSVGTCWPRTVPRLSGFWIASATPTHSHVSSAVP